MTHVILNQARVHDRYLEVMQNSSTRLTPHYFRKLVDLTRTDTEATHPITATRVPSDAAHATPLDTVRAQYVAGCEAACCAVRHSIGRELRAYTAKRD